MAVEVGVRELRENLAEWLDRAAAGEEILVTERGEPKARLVAAETPYASLVRSGILTPSTGERIPLPPPILMEPSLTAYLEWSRGGPWPGPGLEPGSGLDEG